MIKDRVCKGTGNLQDIFALVAELTYGVKYMKALLLLYHTRFIPALTFNSEAWTKLSIMDILDLQ